MPETRVVVAVAQLALTVGKPEANRAAVRAAVAEAALAGARLVVLPELSDSGYVFSDAGEARSLASQADSGVTLREWRSLAARHGLVIAGGFCELGPDGNLYNSAAIVDAAGTRAVYRKAHLWDAEKKFFMPGDDPPPVVELPFGNVGLMICYDLEFPEWVRLAALSGADLLAVPVNWPASGTPAPPGERSGEVVAAQAAASSNGVFIAVADRCGTERGVEWLGGSVILRRGGYPAAGPVCENRPAVLTAAIDLRLARDKRIGGLNDLFSDRRPDLYARLWPVLSRQQADD
ncbi:MAG: carbon-nitrogen hydrolase [Actinobacteria bacterium]|nr:carbon-nitrogen hydrolase [Actinomycetota bacterium]MBO0817554.1 carbon-nitrogen hydrolase [Actinomycetota bacterium]